MLNKEIITRCNTLLREFAIKSKRERISKIRTYGQSVNLFQARNWERIMVAKQKTLMRAATGLRTRGTDATTADFNKK